MTCAESILLLDPSATVREFQQPDGTVRFWVTGNSFCTQATFSEERAWELATGVMFIRMSEGMAA